MEDPVGRDEYVISRLRQILRRHHERASWNQISKDIQAANGGEGYATVDRRTLPLICSVDKYDQVWLSLAQLVALDKYFVLTNEGPLFVRTRSLIDSIAETSEVVFYVAAKYHRELGTDAVSAFDLRAITTLLRSRLSRMTNSIIDVVSPKDWRASKRRSETIANVAVGSPVVNYASDRLLSSMLGFDVNNKTHTERLPFFIVRRPNERRLTSGFIRTKLHAIRRNAIEAESISKDHRALVFENRVFVANERTGYSLLVAQRDPVGERVRTVLAGLSGLGTLELARILQAGGPMKELPELRPNQKHPPILAAVYKHTLEGRRSKAKKTTETRTRIAGSTAVLGPLLLHHIDGSWQSLPDAS